jgi:hypothetical protein
MANTYQIITSTVLTTTTASVTLSSIPQIYKDLVLYIVARTDTVDGNVNLYIRLNADGGTNYSSITYSYYGTALASGINSGSSQFTQGPWAAGTSVTANVFSSNTVYFPNYTNSFNKQMPTFGGMGSSSASAFAIDTATSYRGTSPITSILIPPYSGNFLAGSSFYLYGIANS